MTTQFKLLQPGDCFKDLPRLPGATFMKLVTEDEACIIAGPLVHRGKTLTFEPDSIVEPVMALPALAQVSLSPSSASRWAEGDTAVVGDYGYVNRIQVFAGFYLSTGVSKGNYFSASHAVLWCEKEVAEQLACDEKVQFVPWLTFHYTTDSQLRALSTA